MWRPRLGSRWGIQRGQAWLPLRWLDTDRGQLPSERWARSASTKRCGKNNEIHHHSIPPLNPPRFNSLITKLPESMWTSTQRCRWQNPLFSLVDWVYIAELFNAHWLSPRKAWWEYIGVVSSCWVSVCRSTYWTTFPKYLTVMWVRESQKVRRVFLNEGAAKWKLRKE